MGKPESYRREPLAVLIATVSLARLDVESSDHPKASLVLVACRDGVPDFVQSRPIFYAY